MELKDFKKGDRVLVKCGVGTTMADVRHILHSNGMLVIKPMYAEMHRITPGRILRHYDKDGNLLQVAPPPERKKKPEDAWLN